MEINQSNSERYIIINYQKITVTEEIYRAFYRPEWTQKKQDERRSRCRAEHGNRCTNDCSKCAHTRSGTPVSLDALFEVNQEPAAIGANPEDIVLRRALYEALHDAVDGLEPRNRMVIRMLYFQGMTEREVAPKLGLTQKGVNYLRHKSLRALRISMKDWQ